MRKKHHVWSLLRALLLPVGAVAAVLFFASALDHLDSGKDAQGLRQLEEALRRSCVACYASEGSYPSDLDYLQEHYGIQIDETRYVVHYEIFAPNLMPSITVLEQKP